MPYQPLPKVPSISHNPRESANTLQVYLTNLISYLSTQFNDIDNKLTPFTWCPAIAAAATIKPRTQVQPITGTANISNIDTYRGVTRLVLLAEDGFTLVTGGNIAARVDAPEGTNIILFKNLADNLWYPVGGGGSSSLEAVYPIGSIYLSINDTDPALLFGFGTWELMTVGTILVEA